MVWEGGRPPDPGGFHKDMREFKWKPFSSRELHPQGWLRKQLEIQAAGLSGNLDKIWPDIRDSKWIGGDQDGWERVPYWLDGYIPLAWILDRQDLKETAKRYMDAILDRQEPDGWICPCTPEERQRYDIWAAFLIGKVLTVYGDCSQDPRVLPALYNLLSCLNQHLDHATLFDWGSCRWYECLIPIIWVYQRKPEEWLKTLAFRLQAQGVDYPALCRNDAIRQPSAHYWSYLEHVVNLAMALKTGAVFSFFDNSVDPAKQAHDMLDYLLAGHGTIGGFFTGDECLAGQSPIQGTECCSIVEAMYSYEVLMAVTGECEWADRLEQLAFNALPATLSPDMWTHQYVQMTNQVECTILPHDKVHFTSNSGESHIFGLEPNFGCCTANFNQGWPKFALSSFYATAEGVVSAVPVPSLLETQIQGIPVTIHLETQYPFRGNLCYTVTVCQPVTFAFDIRIPSTAQSALVNGVSVKPGTLYRINRQWEGTQKILVSLEHQVSMVSRPNQLWGVQRGSLIYSVKCKEDWHILGEEKDKMYISELGKDSPIRNSKNHQYPYCDYTITTTTPWNWAFSSPDFQVEERELSECPFSPEGAPLSITAHCVPILWEKHHGVCDPLPVSLDPIGDEQLVELIPYGCTNLRMTEIPAICPIPK